MLLLRTMLLILSPAPVSFGILSKLSDACFLVTARMLCFVRFSDPSTLVCPQSVFEKEQCVNILKAVVEETLSQNPYSHPKVQRRFQPHDVELSQKTFSHALQSHAAR